MKKQQIATLCLLAAAMLFSAGFYTSFYLIRSGYGLEIYSSDSFVRLSARPMRPNNIDGGIDMEVSGHHMGSLYCIGPIDQNFIGTEINILMTKPLICGLPEDGNFTYVINVPSNMNLVSFGVDRKVIWRRAR